MANNLGWLYVTKTSRIVNKMERDILMIRKTEFPDDNQTTYGISYENVRWFSILLQRKLVHSQEFSYT